MASLPDDVFLEILLRLPARSIARSRAVCRAWRAATSHPSFDRALAERRPPAVAKLTPAHTYTWDGRHYLVQTDPRLAAPPLATLVHFSPETLRSWDGVLCADASSPPPRTTKCGNQAPRERRGECVLFNPLTWACAVVAVPAGGGGRIIGGYTHPATGRFHLLHCEHKAVSGDGGGDRLAAAAAIRILPVGDAHWREGPLLPTSGGGGAKILMKSHGDRSVNLHGNLHWLVQVQPPPGSGAAAAPKLLVFDAAREELRLAAAPASRALDVATARCRLLPGGKLCVLALAGRWRLRDTVRVVLRDGTDLSPAFAAAGTDVEVVEGAEEGEEILLRVEAAWVRAYSFRYKWWGKVNVTRFSSAGAQGERHGAGDELRRGDAGD
ncbi:hypothetical protein ACP4OV_012546 [Aristida adscensionis]